MRYKCESKFWKLDTGIAFFIMKEFIGKFKFIYHNPILEKE